MSSYALVRQPSNLPVRICGPSYHDGLLHRKPKEASPCGGPGSMLATNTRTSQRGGRSPEPVVSADPGPTDSIIGCGGAVTGMPNVHGNEMEGGIRWSGGGRKCRTRKRLWSHSRGDAREHSRRTLQGGRSRQRENCEQRTRHRCPGVSGTGSSTRWPALEEGPQGRLQAGKGLTVR